MTVHDGEGYEARVAKEDLQILSSIKANPKLYKALLADPERNSKVISNNLKRVLPEIDS